MRWFAAVSLALFLTLSLVVAAAQIRGMPITPDQRMQLGTAAGSVRAGDSFRSGSIGPSSSGPRFIGPTGFHSGFHNPNASFHHYRYPRSYGVIWPYYAPYYSSDYSYAPYALDYDSDSAYNGYAPGTFSSTPYAGSQYPAQYPPPPNYYSPSGPPPPANSAPEPQSNQYQTPSPRSSQRNSASDEFAEPTVLIFRDGHRQEIANYAIMGSTLLVLSGPRSKIPLAELDIPATEQENQSRGVDFSVPEKAR